MTKPAPSRRTAKRRGERAAAGTGSPASRVLPPRGGGHLRLAVASGAIVGVVALALVFGRWKRSPSAPLPFPGMSAEAAAESAATRITKRQHLSALPYLRQVDRVAKSTSANFQAQAAVAGNNATFEVRSVDEFGLPATRSSVERVALMRESFERLERAEAQSDGPEEQRNIMTTRANFFALWGFARESYMEYRRADQTMPLDETAHRKASWIETLLDDPTRRLTAADSAAGGLLPR